VTTISAGQTRDRCYAAKDSRPRKFSVLESVENLFERELNARQNAAMTAGDPVTAGSATGEWKCSRSRCDDEWKVRDDQSES
jgi:hypothetical protein